MGQLPVRGLDERIIRTLRQRAVRAGRSVAAGHRAILEQVRGPEMESPRLRAQSPPQRTDSADPLRADHDRNRGSAP